MATQEVKIIFTGPDSAGKTSAIKTVNQLEPMTASDQRGLTTTVGLDYGELTLDRSLILRLYGTTGEAYSYLWKMVSRGAAGFVLLINNQRDLPLSDLGEFLDHFNFQLKRAAVVIGVTHSDKAETPTLEEYQHFLEDRKVDYPVAFIDARSRKDVLMLLDTLFSELKEAGSIESPAD